MLLPGCMVDVKDVDIDEKNDIPLETLFIMYLKPPCGKGAYDGGKQTRRYKLPEMSRKHVNQISRTVILYAKDPDF